jgi:hypothetical protein
VLRMRVERYIGTVKAKYLYRFTLAGISFKWWQW